MLSTQDKIIITKTAIYLLNKKKEINIDYIVTKSYLTWERELEIFWIYKYKSVVFNHWYGVNQQQKTLKSRKVIINKVSHIYNIDEVRGSMNLLTTTILLNQLLNCNLLEDEYLK